VAFQYVTDLEGPVTLNDNAFELCRDFLPEGEIFFSQVSRYDDYLNDIEKKAHYQAGDTLKLISPFLKAYGVTDRKMKEYSREHLILLPSARETLKKIAQKMPTFIISTSYQAYLEAFCEKVGFPLANVYFTKLNLDHFVIGRSEERWVKDFQNEIVTLPLFDFGSDVKSFEDLPLEAQSTIDRLNKIFWEELSEMQIGRILKEINPVGAREKALALQDCLKKTGGSLSEVFYVVDSITDFQTLKLVKAGGGFSLSFNGNRYAIAGAEVACISSSGRILFELAEAFNDSGKKKVMEIISQGQYSEARRSDVHLEIIDNSNRKKLIKESETFRQKLRGKAGTLG